MTLAVASTTPPTTALDVSYNGIDGGAVAINIGVGSYSRLGAIKNNVFGDNQYFKTNAILLNNPRASIGLSISANVYGAIDRGLSNAALSGTTIDTGNDVHGG